MDTSSEVTMDAKFVSLSKAVCEIPASDGKHLGCCACSFPSYPECPNMRSLFGCSVFGGSGLYRAVKYSPGTFARQGVVSLVN